MPYREVRGDATRPQGSGPKVILHVVNDLGGWRAGFVMALSKRWPQPEAAYRAWARGEAPGAPPFELGRVQFVSVEEDLWVANMLAQSNRHPEPIPLQYDALDQCLESVGQWAAERGASLHFPQFGAGIAGGDWGLIEPLVERRLVQRGLQATLYRF